MSTLTDYRLVARDITRWQKFTSSKPDVALAVKYYQSNIGKVKSIDDLLKNDRLFAFAMNAYGLGDRLYAKGLIKQVLQQGMDEQAPGPRSQAQHAGGLVCLL